ncbi:MarR family winged helix-turn-helix transcriptional regulator [Pseudoduganella violaceinigra]|uniref:MarR family winged helix-turn-helix transcriptional regulator n=1 Tax=Pseudoduganella violaceinigra TaxID=246602 RepID=UPI0003FBB0F4|nr:MarR family transcriptional regulator [Pseudoduganella violaceinigra]
MNKIPLPRRVARLISRAQSVLADELDAKLAPFDITAAQYVVLSTLHSGRANIAAQICKELSYSPGAMTRMLNRLEQKGMIQKGPSLDSRRTVRLELTEAGQRLFPSLLAASGTVIADYFGTFSTQELETFEALLLKMFAGK